MNTAREPFGKGPGRVWLVPNSVNVDDALIQAALDEARWHGSTLSALLLGEPRGLASARLACSLEIARLGGRARPLDPPTLATAWQQWQSRLRHRLVQAAAAAGVELDLHESGTPDRLPALLPDSVVVLPRPVDQPGIGSGLQLLGQWFGDAAGNARHLLWIPTRRRTRRPGRVVAVARGGNVRIDSGWLRLALELGKRREQALTVLTLEDAVGGRIQDLPAIRRRCLRHPGRGLLLAHLQAEGTTELILERTLVEQAPYLLESVLETLAVPVSVLD